MTINVGIYIGNENLIHCWWEHKLVQTLWQSIWRFLKKLKTVQPYNLFIPLLGVFCKDSIVYYRDACSSMFLAALVIIEQEIETT